MLTPAALQAALLAKLYRYKPQSRVEFAALCAKSGNENTPHSIPRPVQTRWNSMFLTLERINTHVNKMYVPALLA